MTVTPPPIRTLIVDDEPPARRKLRRFLESDAQVAIVGEAKNGEEAARAIREHRPDLVFLDVQMPGMDGFGVIEATASEHAPSVIFVTAYDDHAVRAFEVSALDYLLKPFDRERFDAALAKAKAEVARRDHADLRERLDGLLQHLDRQHTVERFLVRSRGRVTFVQAKDVAWLEGAGNYVRLHAGTDTHLIRDTLDSVGSQLDPRRFVRVHRSHIVNLDYVREMSPWAHGDYVIVMRDGVKLKLSRRYRDRLPPHLGDSL
jgi:two-component system, LytTR family, response regulator